MRAETRLPSPSPDPRPEVMAIALAYAMTIATRDALTDAERDLVLARERSFPAEERRRALLAYETAREKDHEALRMLREAVGTGCGFAALGAPRAAERTKGI